jgi:hypothetical protein
LLLANRDGVFGVAVEYGVDDRGSVVRFPVGVRDFYFLIQTGFWDPADLLFNDYWRSKGDHSPPSTAEVKNEWSYTSVPPICRPAAYSDSFSTFTHATGFCDYSGNLSLLKRADISAGKFIVIVLQAYNILSKQ